MGGLQFMKISKLSDMVGGWFVGDFLPTHYQTPNLEVSYKIHPQGEKWDIHYHQVATEINLLVRGNMTLQGQPLVQGDIFSLEPNEIADPVFLTDCEIVCVKVPGALNDKYTIDINYANHLVPGDVVVQIGANDGVVCEEYGLRNLILDKEFIVHLIEPVKEQFVKLQNNYSQAHSQITFHNLAIWDRCGQKELIIHGPSDTESSFVLHDSSNSNNTQELVEVQTIDVFLQKNNIFHIDGLFLDVEGVEDVIITELFHNTSLRPKIIRYEFAHIQHHARLKETIEKHGYYVTVCPSGAGDMICIRKDLTT